MISYWDRILRERTSRRRLLAITGATAAAAFLAACGSNSGDDETTAGQQSEPNDKPSTTYVLVRAAWLGAWAWDGLTPLLTQEGHRAVAVELPGHGADKTPASEVALDGYVNAVTSALDAHGPSVLVGHSVGGIVISQAAEARPDKVSALVYVSGFLLPDGASFVAATEGVEGSMVLDNLVFTPDGNTVTVRDEAMHEAFAHDVPADAFDAVRPLIVPEPTAPLSTALSLTDANWGRLPRYYVECLQDRAIPLAVQQAMYQALPVRQVFSMQTSHSPNFAAPQELAEHLIAVTREV